MSTANEHAQPNPADQPNPAVVAGATPETPPPLGVTSIEEIDPDLQELQDAKAAAKAEEAAPPASAAEQVNGNAAPAAAASEPPPRDQKPQGIMVPKERLDEALNQRDEARQQAAYHRGLAEARTPQGQPAGNGQQPAAPTPEQRLAEVHTAIDALAEKFDAGEITMTDFKKQERALDTKAQGIREEVLLAKVPKAATAPEGNGGDTLYLETLTADLEKNHPWVAIFDKAGTDADWKYLEDTARGRLAERGVKDIKGAVGSYELRKEIASLTDELGPALLTTRAKAQGLTLPGQSSPPAGQPQQQQPQPLSPTAQNRLGKLQQQGNAPPDVSAMGGGSAGAGVPDSSIAEMSDEEIAALPQATRRRLLGTTR